MSSELVALIIGAGANVGESVAQKLASNGYKVAVGSRQGKPSNNSAYYPFAVDITQPETVKAAFDNVTAAIGPPNVVVFNAATFTMTDAADPLSLPYETYAREANSVNSFYIAAQEAVKAFRAHKDVPKVFIVTGNVLGFPPAIIPNMLGLGLQKRSNSYLTELFDKSYSAEGMRFHFAQYVSAKGGIPPLDSVSPDSFFKSGPTHAEVYWRLISSGTESWDYRFTFDGKKYEKSAL